MPVTLRISRAHHSLVQSSLATRASQLAVRALFYFLVPAALACVFPLRAQQSSPALSAALTEPSLPEPIALKESPSVESPAPIQPRVAPSNDRLFWVMPNYLSVEGHQEIQPLSAKIKFRLSEKTMTDPVTVSFLGTLALMSQAGNSNPSYGQELSGYAKRYATLYANTGIGTLMTASVFPTVFKQDPRYFQLGSGSPWRRTVYSLSRIFVTRGDSGAVQFNYSEILGNGVAAGLSNTYLPQNQRNLGNTLRVWGANIMLNTICNVAKEFWPDLRRKARRPRNFD
jgi:hypothetical protein